MKTEGRFEEGVAWVIEELSMRMQKDAVIDLWDSSLSDFREDLIKIMKENNSEIYTSHVKPYIKEIKGYTRNI